ncbi:hypothetical protein HYV50_01560 [Candidatus Pacearchaeota archaeon]|nr:hypothetical protein [Candidatus Pacearchaeota archaeon]
MKREIFIFGLFLLIFLSFLATAQELETTIEEEAGVTPDSAVWGIDRALERIALALTIDNTKKENKRLQHARERLLEVKKMLEENKLEHAEKAKEEHKKLLEISKIEIASIKTGDKDDLASIESLKDSIDAQESLIDDINIKIKISGSLTEEQRKKLEEFIASLGENVEKVKIVIKDKEEETLTKIEIETGKTKIEIIDELGKLKEEKIVRSEVFDTYSVIKVGYRFTTRTTDREKLLAEIIERFAVSEDEVDSLLKIENAEDNESDRDKLWIKIETRVKDDIGISQVKIILRKNVDVVSEDELKSAVVEATHLTKEQVLEALVLKEKHEGTNESESEIEIRSKTEDGLTFTKIKIEWGGTKEELILHTNDRTEIVEHIAGLLGVSAEEVEAAIIKFEIREEDETNNEDKSNDVDENDDSNDTNHEENNSGSDSDNSDNSGSSGDNSGSGRN